VPANSNQAVVVGRPTVATPATTTAASGGANTNGAIPALATSASAGHLVQQLVFTKAASNPIAAMGQQLINALSQANRLPNEQKDAWKSLIEAMDSAETERERLKKRVMDLERLASALKLETLQLHRQVSQFKMSSQPQQQQQQQQQQGRTGEPVVKSESPVDESTNAMQNFGVLLMAGAGQSANLSPTPSPALLAQNAAAAAQAQAQNASQANLKRSFNAPSGPGGPGFMPAPNGSGAQADQASEEQRMKMPRVAASNQVMPFTNSLSNMQ
jgi:hypothetical protein